MQLSRFNDQTFGSMIETTWQNTLYLSHNHIFFYMHWQPIVTKIILCCHHLREITLDILSLHIHFMLIRIFDVHNALVNLFTVFFIDMNRPPSARQDCMSTDKRTRTTALAAARRMWCSLNYTTYNIVECLFHIWLVMLATCDYRH